MGQPTLASQGFEKYRMKTRKQQFLDEMEQVVPWQELVLWSNPIIRHRRVRDAVRWALNECFDLLPPALVWAFGPGGRRGAA